jgi:peptide deformylase
MPKILQVGENVLRENSQKIPLIEIVSSETKKILAQMKESLDKEEDGVAIAAPQIGYTKRIFVVSEKVFRINEREVAKDKSQDLVYINPKITSLSREKELMNEGCLSVRWKYGKVKRSKKVSVEAYDENGKKFKRGASGLLAQIFQHEIDHLDGILFVDKAKDLREYIPETPEDLTK